MKKYLFFIISMLCVSIGTWADATTYKFPNSETGPSTAVLDGTVLTVTIESESDIKSSWSLPSGLSLTGVNTVKIVTAPGVTLSCGNGNAMHFVYSIYGGVPVVDLSAASINLLDNTLSASTDEKMWNIVVPSSFSTSLSDLVVSSIWYSGTHYNTNNYSISGTTVNAYLGRTDHLTPLSNISSTATTLKLAEDVTGALDLSSSSVLVSGNTLDLTNVTTIADGSNGNDITVAAGVKVVCLKDGVKDRIKGTDASNITVADPVISCTALELDDKLTELRNVGVAPTSITITGGTLSTEQMANFGTLVGLTYLSLQDDAGTNIGSLTLPSTLEVLVLPKKASGTKSSVTNAMKTHANLKYIYAPYSGTQDANQMVADYVWVNKPGGLAKAFDEQAGLRNAWYMIVESTVALNNDDVNFWGSDPEHPRVMQYRYLDLSGANITPAVAANYRVTDQEAYRIILPNDWTGDMMNVFANITKANRGSIAAVYSYTGTAHKRLDILEIDDYAYLSTALHDARIVREGTEEVRVISGPNYSKFGTKLLTALNSADDTPNDPETNHITSVTIAVGSGIYKSVDTNSDGIDDTDQLITESTTFAFANTHLTKLTMNYINNKYLTIDVSGCTALEELYLNETTLAGVNASGCSKLTTASLGHAIVGDDVVSGDVNLSGTKLTSLLEVDQANITGTLDVSNTSATSFDFTQLTAIKVDASNTNALTSLNINGISLNGDEFTPNDDTKKDGKIDVTRSSNNYSDLTITKAQAFDAERIIPQASSITPAENAYKLRTIAPSHVEITAAGSSLSDNIGNIWLDTDGNNTADAHPTQSEIEILHVTGTITTGDLNYIAGMTGLKTLDLSEATGVTYSDIINAGLSTKTAIILPGTTNTENDMVTAMNAFQTAGYECVGYYTAKSETSKKLNVYGYNGTVANLKTGNITSQINATEIGATGTMVEQPKLIDTKTDLTFLPVYGKTTASVPYLSTDNISYPQATPSLLTAFRDNFNGDDYPYSVDMSWLDISNLGVDFSGVKCRHLVIPQNTMAETTTRNSVVYHNDFTDETADAVVDGTQHRYYKYNEMVYAVSTYKGTTMPYATSAYFGGRGMLFDVYNLNETANLTYLRSAGQGNLDDVVSHMSPLLQGADVIMLKGTLTGDIDGLNALTNDRIDLTRATMTSMSGFDNDNVKYLALPDGMNNAIAATSVDEFAFNNCAALKAVGAYDPTNTKYTVHSTANTVTFTDAPANTTFSDQENSVFEITKMCAPNASRQAGSALGTTNIVMSGYLTLSDIQMDGADSQAGLNTNSSGSVVTADFSNAVFMDNSHMCFTAATWNGNALTSILLPTDERQNTIPARCLYNYSALTEICIPYNYEHIGNAAFYLANLGHITTTDANGALVDNGAHTFTFSKNLKEIGDAPSSLTTGTGNAAYPTPLAEPVFFSFGYHDLTDIYVLRSGYEDGEPFNPTKCYRNAFGAGPTYGWGGFDGGNVYCREKYMNGSQLYTVLHFPDLASVSNDETKYENVKKAYTDPTRVYTKKDQTGAVDANGESPQWPTHSELGRAYNEAIRGLIWEDWNIDTEKQANGNINGGTITTPPGNPADVTPVASPTKFDMNYTGWHEFVLSIATYVAPDEKVEDNIVIRTYEEDDWYTFCIPFDMTEQEVALLLGVPRSTDEDPGTNIKIINSLKTADSKGNPADKVTENIMPTIVTLKQVTRNSTTNTVSLSCSLDMGSGANKFKYYSPSANNYISNGYVDLDGDSGDDEDEKIMIRAGYPYIIRPYTLCDPETGVRNAVPSNNLGKQILTRYAFKMIASAINHSDTREAIGSKFTNEKSNFAKPYEGHKVQALSDDQNSVKLYHDNPTNNKPYNYTFVGQYWTQYLPQNCFYMSGHKWYHNTYPREEGYYWYPYTCLILTSNEDGSGLFRYDTDNTKYGETNYAYTIIPQEVGKDAKNHAVFDKEMQIRFKDGLDDSFTTNAREYHFVFDDDIMDFGEDGQTTEIEVLNGQYVAPVRGEVYNMAGQHVGNSLNGLPKGMYIVNGKKIVIK